jgi:hypothetical protein
MELRHYSNSVNILQNFVDAGRGIKIFHLPKKCMKNRTPLLMIIRQFVISIDELRLGALSGRGPARKAAAGLPGGRPAEPPINSSGANGGKPLLPEGFAVGFCADISLGKGSGGKCGKGFVSAPKKGRGGKDGKALVLTDSVDFAAEKGTGGKGGKTLVPAHFAVERGHGGKGGKTLVSESFVVEKGSGGKGDKALLSADFAAEKSIGGKGSKVLVSADFAVFAEKKGSSRTSSKALLYENFVEEKGSGRKGGKPLVSENFLAEKGSCRKGGKPLVSEKFAAEKGSGGKGKAWGSGNDAPVPTPGLVMYPVGRVAAPPQSTTQPGEEQPR